MLPALAGCRRVVEIGPILWYIHNQKVNSHILEACMSNDPAMELAVAAGDNPLGLFSEFSSAILNMRLGRIEALIFKKNRAVSDIVEVMSEITTIKSEIKVACDAFLIWKGLHTDLVRKWNNVDAPDANRTASLRWIGAIMIHEKLQLVGEKMVKFE